MKKLAFILLAVLVLILVLDLKRIRPKEIHLQPSVTKAANITLPLVQQSQLEKNTPAPIQAPYLLAPGEFIAGEELVLNPFTGKGELPPSHEGGLVPGEFWAEGEEWVYQPTPTSGSDLQSKGGKLADYINYGVYKQPPQGCTWIKAKYSHYWPPWGGPNCANFQNGYCYSRTSSGTPWENLTGYGAAMPKQYAFGTKIYYAGQEWQVWDRGGKIVTKDGIPWIDLMTPKYLANYGSIVDICIVKP